MAQLVVNTWEIFNYDRARSISIDESNNVSRINAILLSVMNSGFVIDSKKKSRSDNSGWQSRGVESGGTQSKGTSSGLRD